MYGGYAVPSPREETNGWASSLVRLMKECWHKDPMLRPSAPQLVKKLLRPMGEQYQAFRESKILDEEQAEKLVEWYGAEWRLIYRASADGRPRSSIACATARDLRSP